MTRRLLPWVGLLAFTALLSIPLAMTATAPPADVDAPTVLHTAPVGTPLSAPGRGNLYMCRLNVLLGHAPPPVSQVDVPWRDGNLLSIAGMEQVAVPGAVPVKHRFKVTTTRTTRTFMGNGMPPWPIGIFPIPPDSAAYSYYSPLPALPPYPSAAAIPVKPYHLHVSVTRQPKVNKKPTCIDSFSTGVSLDGVTWHAELAGVNPTTFVDPNAALPTDRCFGHPWNTQYHIHGYSWKCMTRQGRPGEASPLLGYAWDGFGVYGPRGPGGKWITNAQLDECHGRTSTVMWEGKMRRMYHYVLNNEFPYSIGCFRGTPAKLKANLRHKMSERAIR